MRRIQTRQLPDDWLENVSQFDIPSSGLSVNNKIIAQRLKSHILSEKNDSLFNPPATKLITHIIFDDDFPPKYDGLPQSLIEEGMKETKGSTGLHFTSKFHSVLIELYVCIRLQNEGYKLIESVRADGDCDLKMEKGGKEHNFEVKFKESPDILKSRLFDCIDGMSLLEEYAYFRGKAFDIHVKSSNINYSTQKEILIEVKKFITEQEGIYRGSHIDIFDTNRRTEMTRDITKVNEYVKSLQISQELLQEDKISQLINEMFIDNNGHVTKLSVKATKFTNFHGCLVWSIPFHEDISSENLKNAFTKLELGFDLHVYLGGVDQENYEFIIDKSTS